MLVDIVLIALTLGTLAAGLIQIRVTARQPLTSAEMDAARELGLLAEATSQKLVELVLHDSEKRPDKLGEITSRWKAQTSHLGTKLTSDLKHRIESVSTFLELSASLQSYEDSGWLEVCHWACADVRLAAEARARLQRRSALNIFPSAVEVRRLLARGQSLKSGLEELRQEINANTVNVIQQEAKTN